MIAIFVKALKGYIAKDGFEIAPGEGLHVEGVQSQEAVLG
jgi:hypothetical protein